MDGCVVLWQIHSVAVDHFKNAIMQQSFIISAAPKWIWELQYLIFRSNTQIRVSKLKRSMKSLVVLELVETESHTEDFVVSFISLAIKFAFTGRAVSLSQCYWPNAEIHTWVVALILQSPVHFKKVWCLQRLEGYNSAVCHMVKIKYKSL